MKPDERVNPQPKALKGDDGWWPPAVDLPNPKILLLTGAMAMAAGSSYTVPDRPTEPSYVVEEESTSSIAGWEMEGELERQSTRGAIHELRRISGLTWDQLGELFGVTRRSVHFWASGRPLAAENETRLFRILDVVRHADRGFARRTRAALLEAVDGEVPFELLVAGRWEAAREKLGKGPGSRYVPNQGKPSPEARAARQPLPVADLLGARHERIHRDLGKARGVRTLRNRNRERD